MPLLSRARAGFLAALTLAACSACSFGDAQATPTRPSAPTTNPSTSAAATPSASDEAAAARVDVDRPGGGSPAVITVTVEPAGSAGAAECGDATTQWIPFSIDFADHGADPTKQYNEHTNLGARVEVRGGSGDVGVLLDSNGGGLPDCPGAGKLPASDTFSTMVISGGYHVRTSGYVLVRGSGAPAGLTLAVTGLQKKPDDIYPPESWTWQVQRFESGGACPGSPSSICVPLG